MEKALTPSQPVVYRCPKCDGVGKPIPVTTTRAGSVKLHFNCPYCQQTWSVTKFDHR